MTLDDLARQALARRRRRCSRARVARVRPRVSDDGKLSAARSSASSTPRTASPGSRPMSRRSSEMAAYAERMQAEGRFGETEELLTRIGLGEYLAQIFGGIPMNQGEFVRPADFGLDDDDVAALRNGAVAALIATGNTPANRARARRADRATRTTARSAIPASTRRSRRCATRCAASPTPRSSRTRKTGTAPTPTSRSRSSPASPRWACSA